MHCTFWNICFLCCVAILTFPADSWYWVIELLAPCVEEKWALLRNRVLVKRSTKEAIWVIDAKNAEHEHTRKKFRVKADFADMHTREAFQSKTCQNQ